MDDVYSTILKIADVSGGDHCAASTDNRGDLAVGIQDRFTCRVAAGCDLGIASGSGAVERQDAACEILIDHRVDGADKAIAPLTSGQDRDASPKFRLTDRGREKRVSRVIGEPCQDRRVRAP